MTDKTGGLAFPVVYHDGDGQRYHNGMSLRDWLAGQALIGLLAEPVPEGGSAAVYILSGRSTFEGSYEERFACAAYKLADAMLRERAK